jgi:membrane protease YdiL (CAAX protease family)
MASIAAYFALGAFPILALLTPEPVQLRWGIKHAKLKVPLPPLPPELRERSEQNDRRYLRFLQIGLLCTCIYLLMRRYSVPATTVGLHLQGWPSFILVRVAAGLTYLTYLAFLSRVPRWLGAGPAPDRPLDYLSRGSPVLWVVLFLVGCFGEEYWRAFCLVSLEQRGHGAAFAVLATSVAFGLAHYGARQSTVEVGRMFGHATFGALLAVVFLWSGSIVPNYTGHLLVNLVALYRARKLGAGLAVPAPAAGPTPSRPCCGARGMVTCPVCGWKMRRGDIRRERFACPGCKERLRLEESRNVGLIMVGSGLVALLISFVAGVQGYAFLWCSAILRFEPCFM